MISPMIGRCAIIAALLLWAMVLVFAALTPHVSTAQRWGLTLQNVNWQGSKLMPQHLARQIIEPLFDQPLYGIDLKALHHTITHVGWIHTAHIRRRWPDSIDIFVTERTPVAILHTSVEASSAGAGPVSHLVDARGEAIMPLTKSIEDLIERRLNTPLLHVVGSAAHSTRLIEAFKPYPELMAHIRYAENIRNQRWRLHTHNNTIIELPQNSLPTSLPAISPEFSTRPQPPLRAQSGALAHALQTLASLERRHQLLTRTPVVLDLRQDIAYLRPRKPANSENANPPLRSPEP